MQHISRRGLRIWGASLAVAIVAAGGFALFPMAQHEARADNPPPAAPQAIPVSVAVVQPRDTTIWDEFSGRLEAVERVDIRARVSGAVQSIHFREGTLVKQGDLLVTIDPAPYQAEIERARANVGALQARITLTKSDMERAKQLNGSQFLSQRDLDQRINAHREAEANLKAAQAAVQTAQLNLNWTQVRAPVSGRVGKIEVTVGNLVDAGPTAPVLTSLVSINPIYGSFDADEQVVMSALKSLAGSHAMSQLEHIPVRMGTALDDGTPNEGHLQLIDNQVDTRSGTVRVRAVFDNASGNLMPGQFARLRMGKAQSQQLIAINERAIGTDQSKKFVMVVGADNKVAYREVVLGSSISDNLRIVTSGLNAGDRIVVNGLQRVRPGALVAPQVVPMENTKPGDLAQR